MLFSIIQLSFSAKQQSKISNKARHLRQMAHRKELWVDCGENNYFYFEVKNTKLKKFKHRLGFWSNKQPHITMTAVIFKKNYIKYQFLSLFLNKSNQVKLKLWSSLRLVRQEWINLDFKFNFLFWQLFTRVRASSS